MGVTKWLKPSGSVSRIGEPRLPLWVTYGLSAPPSCESAPGGTADEKRVKAEFGAQMPVAGGEAEPMLMRADNRAPTSGAEGTAAVDGAVPELRLLAISGHSVPHVYPFADYRIAWNA